jgi:RNA polymerase sigma factor (sigma-70 family)
MTEEWERGFVALFEAHVDALLGYALRRTPQLGDAEDVVAETFVIAWRRIESLPAEHHRAWLYGIARRVIANQRRASARRGRLLDRLRGAVSRERPSAVPTDVAAALEQLPPADQELLRLVAWEDLSHAEIGAVLGITPNAVAIRLHRARSRLGRAMKGSRPDRTFPGWRASVTPTSRTERNP